MVDLQAQAFHTDTQIISIAPGQLRPHMVTTYIYNLDHLILRVATTGSKYLMGAQHTVQELKGKAAISHLGECVAVEGFFLWSSQQIQLLRVKAFQLLTGLYHVVKKQLSAYSFIFDKTYFFIRKKCVSTCFILINEKIYSKTENIKCSSKVHVCHHFPNFDCIIIVYCDRPVIAHPPFPGTSPKTYSWKTREPSQNHHVPPW